MSSVENFLNRIYARFASTTTTTTARIHSHTRHFFDEVSVVLKGFITRNRQLLNLGDFNLHKFTLKILLLRPLLVSSTLHSSLTPDSRPCVSEAA